MKNKKQKILTIIFLLAVSLLVDSLYNSTTSSTGGYRPHVVLAQARTEADDTFLAVVTAYSEFDSCHYDGCPMASGVPAFVGAIACPRAIPLGTKVQISNTIYTCHDRTNKSLDGRFDIFAGYGQSAYDNAIQFGKRNLEIKIIL